MSILRRHIDEGYRSMKFTRLVLMLLAIGMFAPASQAQLIGTTDWTDFGSFTTTINAAPVPIGSFVQAFDPQGVLCGQCTTKVAGWYGALAVYGDDPFSGGDEGCILNDVITFKINGREATKLGPDAGVWVGNGPTHILDLESTQSFLLDLTSDPDDAGLAGAIVTYTVTVRNDGDGIDLVRLNLSSALGWTVGSNANPAGFYMLPGEEMDFEVEVLIPASAPVGQEDELTATASSQFDGTVSADKLITTTVDQQTDVDDIEFVIPGQFALAQNYPNPFNPETKISFVMEQGADVSLAVFDILGRKVSMLHSGYLPTGNYEFSWYGNDQNGRQAASGIYFYRLSTGDQSITRKMTLLK